ncbi:MAG: tetratricopeptide repeat protein [Chloroflexi bacterium]|nr:tetratricopeptide repeat protein [Chloroflexota bacterium]
MGQPFSRTKVSLPRRRKHLLARPRLMNLLNQFLDKKLILISAPAGYGKTSLLVDYASKSELPVCWLTLDELDRDPQRFINYFIAALAERFPKFGAETRAALNGVVSLEEGLESLVVTLTNEVYDTIREHFILALDDYHLVEDVELIRAFIARFVKLSDENCHLALSSRRLTHLPNLPRMIADEQVEGLDFAELAFRPEEIQALFAQNRGIKLTEDSARDLAKQSEGWITGLQLAGFSGGTTERVRVAHAAGLDLNQYFDEQALAPQPPEVRLVLLYASLFDEFDADLCRAVLGNFFSKSLNWPSLLNHILENNLFVLPVGSDGRWLRYHHLFRDFLRARLQEEHPDLAQTIQLRLMEAYEARSEWERAYHVCHQFNDAEKLAGLVERAGAYMFRRAALTLTDWLNALPPALANSRPGILSLRGGIGYLRGHYREALSLLDQAVTIYRARSETPGLALALVRRSVAHFNLGEYSAAVDDADEALKLTQDSPNLQSDHAEAQRAKGIALNRMGRTRQAAECLERSLALYTDLNETDSIPILLLSCGSAYRALGNYEAAEKSYLAAEKIWRKDGNLSWQSAALNNLALLYHEALGEYEKANIFYKEALVCASRCRYLASEAMIEIGLGELYMELGETDGARQSFEQAEAIAREIEDRFVGNHLAIAQAALSILLGEHEQARQTLAQARPAIEASQSQYLLGLWLLQSGRLELTRGEARAAIKSLERAEQLFDDGGRQFETMWARVWLAAALSSAGKGEAARETFKLLLEKSRTTPHALAATIRRARPWLEGVRADASIGRLAAPAFQQADRLEARMPALRRDLRRIPQSVTLAAPRLSVQSLGLTKVTVNAQEVDWPTQSVRELFFLFLTSEKMLSKDRVAEALWPDFDEPERVRQRFKNEMYRLRRAIGFADIILHDGESYRFNRSIDYDHDLEDFETYLARARAANAEVERVEHYEKAVRLMRGPYLADIGATWAIPDRERLLRLFIEAAIHLAEIYNRRGDAENTLETCRRALKLDPACEPAHQLAMRAHAAREDRAAVVRQYQACRETSERLFGLPPSEETEALYRKLIA